MNFQFECRNIKTLQLNKKSAQLNYYGTETSRYFVLFLPNLAIVLHFKIKNPQKKKNKINYAKCVCLNFTYININKLSTNNIEYVYY